MKLYNCETKEELELKEIELQALTIDELHELAENIYAKFNNGILEDENITISAIHQINLELLKRLGRIKESTDLINKTNQGGI